ncbi:heat shock protein 15 [mine drainage metagenome]|uniref:Heat shock protein 15 n=1 Tax=mine drainage metagenome TaxID=410659 RepID=A0A1J5RRW9_9ZZZZ
MNDREPCLRLDKWLWAARFFKTRSLAAAAVGAGKVKLGGEQLKPAREVRVGDRLEISHGDSISTVLVLGINEQRRPAPEAQLLYAETPESQTARERAREQQRLAPVPGADLRGRPTKKAGRQIRRFSDPG